MIKVVALKPKRDLVRPVLLGELYKSIKTYEGVGRVIGISGQAVRTYLKFGECPRFIEDAAKTHLANESQPKGKKYLLIARVDQETRDRIQWILEVSHSTFTFQDEK